MRVCKKYYVAQSRLTSNIRCVHGWMFCMHKITKLNGTIDNNHTFANSVLLSLKEVSKMGFARISITYENKSKNKCILWSPTCELWFTKNPCFISRNFLILRSWRHCYFWTGLHHIILYLIISTEQGFLLCIGSMYNYKHHTTDIYIWHDILHLQLC